MLTAFLVVVAVVTTAAIAVGPVNPLPKIGVPQPFPVEEVAGSAQSTTLDDVALDELGIADRVGRSVGFITTPNGIGSGVLIADGLLVTNAHVVWPFDEVRVRFPGAPRLDGRVVGVDARSDLALVHVTGRLPSPLAIGSHEDVGTGATLYAVGYAGAIQLAPVPSVAAGAFRGSFDWEFSGVTWVAAETPAISGQSGGALVDDRGRLVGITTFGSEAEIFAIAVDDVLAIAENLSLTSGDLDDRRPRRTDGVTEAQVSVSGPWEQLTFLVWLPPASRTHVEADGDVELRALDPYGVELAAGSSMIDVSWPIASPGIVHATADAPTTATVRSTAPLVTQTEPDDGARVDPGGTYSGFVDVPGDRDWLVLETQVPQDLSISVEAQTRLRLALYDRSSAALVAEIVNQRGFFFKEDPLVVTDLPAGNYVLVVEDVGAQFGTYRIDLR